MLTEKELVEIARACYNGDLVGERIPKLITHINVLKELIKYKDATIADQEIEITELEHELKEVIRDLDNAEYEVRHLTEEREYL